VEVEVESGEVALAEELEAEAVGAQESRQP
jgi:hypothetical protein